MKARTLEGAEIELSAEAIDELKNQVRGEVLDNNDPAYDEARSIFNAMIDRYPALIVRCSGVADVMAVVDFARANRLLTSVRGGGHSMAGTAVCEGGLMISLENMNGIRIDPENRIGWVSGGCSLGDLDHETAAHGLVCPGGVVSTTGVAGLTTGGGYGWLRGKLGMSIDNLRAVEMVTADGRFVRASETQNPELFWGIRGGGGNFGVVTSFEFRLHPIEPEVMLCNTFYAAEHAETVLRGWRDYMATAPDELTTEFFFWTIPEDDNFPQELHGRDVVIPCAVYYGPVSEGEKAIQPLRELAPPLIDLSAPMRFVDIQQLFDPYLPYNEVYGYWKARYLDSLTDQMCGTLVQHFLDRPETGNLCPVVLHCLNGASQRVSNEATAFPGRNWSYMVEYNITWSDPQYNEEYTAWVRGVWKELRDKYSQRGGAYMNIDSYSDDGLPWVKETFRENFPRLQEIKRQYDPMNLFRLNPNIPPE